jgi:hypothetical protein
MLRHYSVAINPSLIAGFGLISFSQKLSTHPRHKIENIVIGDASSDQARWRYLISSGAIIMRCCCYPFTHKNALFPQHYGDNNEPDDTARSQSGALSLCR